MFSKIENVLTFSKIGNLPEHPQYKLCLLCISELFGEKQKQKQKTVVQYYN